MLRRFVPMIAILALFAFYMLGFVGGVSIAAAQDITPEVTAQPTAEVTPVVVVTPAPAPILTPDNAISVSTLIYGLIIAILGGGTVGLVITRFGSKANMDAAEKLYQSLSPESQAHFRQMFESLRDIAVRSLDLVDKVTDGQPNAEVAQLASGAIHIHSDNPAASKEAIDSAMSAAIDSAKIQGL